ncbi:MAG: Z1 domain-containing protein [Candidatus Omnitrophica bacterium]|nr:Z1 domain-containing protein [Candidatus Omnitrophota bacterium]
MSFDVSKFKTQEKITRRYEARLDKLLSEGIDTSFIEKAVTGAINNINSDIKSFVIYGEPQSGKTEMMISLTAKLLDEGHKIIILLLNDDVNLLRQNLSRFSRSGIEPSPVHFSEILDKNIEIGEHRWVIFSKKNQSNLRKLIQKIGDKVDKVIIDDEADYATPNAKINKGEKTKINELVGKLLRDDGIYIGVTATPARLDLNHTFENANECWVDFPAHQQYTGQDVFFPMSIHGLRYRLELLPDHSDDPKFLREALFRFFVGVAYLNITRGKSENFCMLIHTSGKRADHTDDYKQVVGIFNILKTTSDKKFDSYVKKIWEIAKERSASDTMADKITQYICSNITRNKIVVMNSNTDKRNVNFEDATLPIALFTIAIGGNIVSRGVTFKSLLSMFFTRDVKHKIQQDTYIQRARMFGTRNDYINHFELAIPEKLYLDWHRCFVFHRLALQAIKGGTATPVWLEDKRVAVASSSSIDKTTVSVDSGEMSFEIFQHMDELDNIVYDTKLPSIEKLRRMAKILGKHSLPDYLVDFIENFSPDGADSLAVHPKKSIHSYNDVTVDHKAIKRSKGVIGKFEREVEKYPKAIHHIKVFFNDDGMARVFYRYVGSIKFIKSLRKM